MVPTTVFDTVGALLVAGGTVLLLLVHRSAILTLAFPAAAVALAAWLLYSHPSRYVSWVLWLFMLSPLVRRMVDGQNGWNQQNPILLAPLLACAVCVMDVLHYLPRMRRVAALPLVAAIASLATAAMVGLFLSPAPLVAYAALSWTAPLLLGLHVAIHPEHHDAYHRAIVRTLAVGLVLLGAYGLHQFVSPTEWDRLWMVNSRMDSIGEPLPLRVRVFSTMNAPGPLAQFLTVALPLLLAARFALKWPAVGAGLLLLLASLARSAWLGFLVGVAVLLTTATARARRSVMLLAAAAVLALVPLATIPLPPDLDSMRYTITTRIATMSDLSLDTSFRARRYLIPAVLADIGERPLGSGLGSTLVGGARGAATSRLADQGLYLDNGILEIFLVLGWFGGLLFLGSTAGATLLAVRATRRHRSGYGYLAGASALLAQVIGATIFTNVGGAMLWLTIAMAMTAGGES